MSSTFGTYNTAYLGLYVNQAALATTTNNLANVDTTGASRVRVSSADKAVVTSSSTSVGTGVSVAEIKRVREQWLDQTYRTDNADACYENVKFGNLEFMQNLLSEFDDSSSSSSSSSTSSDGVQSSLEDFYNSWDDLVENPSDETSRETVTSAAAKLLDKLSDIDGQLQQLQADAVNGVTDGVDSLNDLATQVADLNKQITAAESGGGEASYLRDQRDELLDEMSSLANITVNESNGVLQVAIGGITLVNGSTANTLTVDGDGSAANPLTVKCDGYDCTANITSGSIKAFLEDADQSGYAAINASDITGNSYNYTAGATSSISNLRQGLNDLITTLAVKVNSLLEGGYDLDGNSGVALFTAIDDSEPLSISNIQVNPALENADTDGWQKIAVSSSGKEGDGTIAEEIYNLSTATCYQFDGASMKSNNFYKSLISWIGTAGSTAKSSYETKTSLVTAADTKRQSISSISMDEEMSNMIKYQNAYNANAKVMTTIDQLIGEMIETIG